MTTQAERDWVRTVREVDGGKPLWARVRPRVVFLGALALFALALYLLLLVGAVAAPGDLLEGFER